MKYILADVSVFMLDIKNRNSKEAGQCKGVKYILYCSYLHVEVLSLLHHATTQGLRQPWLT